MLPHSGGIQPQAKESNMKADQPYQNIIKRCRDISCRVLGTTLMPDGLHLVFSHAGRTWVEKDRVWTYRASEAVFGQGAGLVSTTPRCHMHIDSMVEVLPLKGRWLPSIRMKVPTTPTAPQTPLVHRPRNRQLDAGGLDQGGQTQ